MRRRWIYLLAVPLLWSSCQVFDMDCTNSDPLCSDGAILLYLADAGCVLRLLGGQIQGCPQTISGTVTTLAGDGTGAFLDGTGTGAQINLAYGITTDGASLFLADRSNHRIRRIVIATGVVTTLAGDGTPAFLNGTGTGAQFNFPSGITTDGTSVFVGDSSNHRIRQIDIASGVVTTLAGDGTPAFMDGTGIGAQFNNPGGLTTDGSSVFVADSGNQRIRRIVIATGVVTTVAGDGTLGFQDGTGTGARVNSPQGLTTDGTDLFIADTNNRRIRKINIATSVVTTIAGDGTAGFLDGTGTSAQFNNPHAVATDGSNLFIADSQNHRIRKFDAANLEVTTLAGDGTNAYLDGAGTAAQFNFPIGITSDGQSLFISDTNNNRLRQIQ